MVMSLITIILVTDRLDYLLARRRDRSTENARDRPYFCILYNHRLDAAGTNSSDLI